MIIDGKKIAGEIVADIGDALRGKTLGVVMNSGDAATQSFVKIKERVAERLGAALKRFSPKQIQDALQCDGIVVQLPIDNAEALLAQIPPQKDVDSKPLPPVAAAVEEILKRAGVDAAGKKAIVVGEGRLVGKPVLELLRNLKADVHVVSLEQGSLTDLKDADIVVSGAGSPGLIKPEMLKRGVVLIDAGTSEDTASAGRRIVGDCDPSCASVASVFTPVPGGIGPIAVAMLFKNLATLVNKRQPL